MSATILTVGDFVRFEEAKTVIENTGEAFIDDSLVVDIYWHDLAKHVGVLPEELPVAPGSKVKEFLIFSVLENIGEAYIGSNIVQISEDQSVDQWEKRRNAARVKLKQLRIDIQTSDVIDPTIEEDEEDVPKNTMLVERIHG